MTYVTPLTAGELSPEPTPRPTQFRTRDFGATIPWEDAGDPAKVMAALGDAARYAGEAFDDLAEALRDGAAQRLARELGEVTPGRMPTPAEARAFFAREREERKKPWPKPDLVMSREAMRDLHNDTITSTHDWVIRRPPDIDADPGYTSAEPIDVHQFDGSSWSKVRGTVEWPAVTCAICDDLGVDHEHQLGCPRCGRYSPTDPLP